MVNETLRELRVEQHPDKTCIGRLSGDSKGTARAVPFGYLPVVVAPVSWRTAFSDRRDPPGNRGRDEDRS